MVNVSLPRDPSARIGSGRPTACVKNAEGTREPQKPWRICERRTSPVCPARPHAGESVHTMPAVAARAFRR